MNRLPIIEEVVLLDKEADAVFLAVNRVDILGIKGLEFYHSFLIILTKYPRYLASDFKSRVKLFYDVRTQNEEEDQVIYFDSGATEGKPIWATTISASSECAADPSASHLGNLIKVPNYDRKDGNKSGNRVYVKKVTSNNKGAIERLLGFESAYDNSEKYALVPEASKNGFNSNSFTRGALEYANLMKGLEFISCFRSPGISKTLKISPNDFEKYK